MTENDLFNKIRLQKGLHSFYEMKNKPIAITIRIILLVVPAIIAFLSISDIEIIKIIFPMFNSNSILVLVSLISLLLFIISVLTEIFGITEKYKEHRIAINQLIKLRKNLQNELEENKDKEKEIIKNYNDIYIELVNTFPEFTDKQYIKGKKYYIERLKCKIELDKKYKEITV